MEFQSEQDYVTGIKNLLCSKALSHTELSITDSFQSVVFNVCPP